MALAAASACIVILAMYFGGVFTRKNNQLFVYNAGEYLDPEVIEMFEEETGIEVVYDEFESNEIMYAKIFIFRRQEGLWLFANVGQNAAIDV